MSDKSKVEALLYKHDYRLRRALKPTVWEQLGTYDTIAFSVEPGDWKMWAQILKHLKQQASGAAGKKVNFTMNGLQGETTSNWTPYIKSGRKTVVISPPRTKGIGIYYEEEKIKPILTPAQLAAEEERRRQWQERRERREARRDAVKAEWKTREQRREALINGVVSIAQTSLVAWKEQAEDFARRVETFPGWTTSTFCPLPVGRDVCQYYMQIFHNEQIERMKDPAFDGWMLEDLDLTVSLVTKPMAANPGAVIPAVLKDVRVSVLQAIENDHINVDKFVEAFLEKRNRACNYRLLALGYVGNALADQFDRLRNEGQHA